MTELGIWVITILTFLFGYAVGIASKFSRQDMPDTYKTGLTDFEKAYRERGSKGPNELKRIGAIPTISQQEIYLRDNPKVKEETEVMSEVFGSLNVKGQKK